MRYLVVILGLLAACSSDKDDVEDDAVPLTSRERRKLLQALPHDACAERDADEGHRPPAARACAQLLGEQSPRLLRCRVAARPNAARREGVAEAVAAAADDSSERTKRLGAPRERPPISSTEVRGGARPTE